MGNVYDQLCNVSAQPASIRYFSGFMWQIGAGWREAMMDKRCDIPAVCQLHSLTGLLRAGMQVKTPLSTSLLYTFSILYTRLLMHTQKIYGLCAHKRLWFHVCLCLFTHQRQKKIWNFLRQFNKLPPPSPSGGDKTWRRSHKVLWHFKNQLTYQYRKEIKFYCNRKVSNISTFFKNVIVHCSDPHHQNRSWQGSFLQVFFFVLISNFIKTLGWGSEKIPSWLTVPGSVTANTAGDRPNVVWRISRGCWNIVSRAVSSAVSPRSSPRPPKVSESQLTYTQPEHSGRGGCTGRDYAVGFWKGLSKLKPGDLFFYFFIVNSSVINPITMMCPGINRATADSSLSIIRRNLSWQRRRLLEKSFSVVTQKAAFRSLVLCFELSACPL